VGQTGTQGNRAGQYFLRVGPQTDVSTYPFYNFGAFCAPTSSSDQPARNAAQSSSAVLWSY